MTKTILILATLILCMSAFGEKITTYLQDRNWVKYEVNQEKPFTGIFEDFLGDRKRHISYKDGKQHGLTTSWFNTGQKYYELNYTKGKREGLGTYWHKNGQVAQKVNKKNGITDLNISWHENGQKKEQRNYKNGELRGITKWYENGKKKKEVNFKDGKPNGLFTIWDGNGETQYKMEIKNGLIYEVNQGKPYTGKLIEKYINGKIRKETNIKDGIENGLLTKWSENGQKTMEVNFKNHKRHGLYTMWGSEGEILYQSTYLDGVLQR